MLVRNGIRKYRPEYVAGMSYAIVEIMRPGGEGEVKIADLREVLRHLDRTRQQNLTRRYYHSAIASAALKLEFLIKSGEVLNSWSELTGMRAHA